MRANRPMVIHVSVMYVLSIHGRGGVLPPSSLLHG